MAYDAEEDEIEQRFRDLCLALNMDKPTMEIAWKAYEQTKNNYTLEGDGLHWLVCALYSSCRRNLPMIKSVAGDMMTSNGVSLTILLRTAQFSFISFLKKMEKWLDMNSSTSKSLLVDHVAMLDRSFRVSTVVFKKYCQVFNFVFIDPNNLSSQSVVKGSSKPPSRPHRSRRHLRRQCSPTELFNFCWTLFVYAKGRQGTFGQGISEELVGSFQLLLSAVDLCFKNAIACENRDQLLNPEFPGLPVNWEKVGIDGISADYDIIALLVQQHAAQLLSKDETEEFLLQARVRHTHEWKNFISSLLDASDAILEGDQYTLLLPANFDSNSKSINKVYEEYVLMEGDFDERVFLCDDVDRELGTPIKNPPAESKTEQHIREVAEHLASETSVAPKTPLTNREYLEGKQDDNVMTTPVSVAHQTIAKLRKILQGRKPEPSSKLIVIFRDCQENPDDEIKNRVVKLSTTFKQGFTRPHGENPALSSDLADSRCIMSTTLYYHALECTIQQEKKRLKNSSADLTGLLKRDDFHKLLFACCFEIVLSAYHPARAFPWIVDLFNLAPYYFYKVIELVVRAEDNLSGQCVKHLNHVEECILESLAWKSDSPLWDSLDDVGVPTCAEVNHQQHVENCSGSAVTNKAPLAHPRLKAVADSDIGIRRSNDSASVQDRFSSPAPGSAKRRLFCSSADNTQTSAVSMKPEESLNTNDTSTSIVESTAQKGKPKRVGSLALFFRKVYHLASVRLRHLCDSLAISVDLQSKIWTCFEHSLSCWASDLMRDRHIDQLLMCSVYIMAKITQHDQSFQEIMRCYRSQPQASSNIYRSVLITRSVTPEPVPSKPTLRSSGVISQPDPPSPPRIPEVREDLIQFYNKVYVPKIRSFVKKFNPDSTQSLEVPLSPMPRPRTITQSPRRVSGNIYVSPLKSNVSFGLTPSRLEFSFQRSPSKELRAINSMLQRNCPTFSTKRHLAFSDMNEQEEIVKAKRPALSKRLEEVHADRNGAK